MIRDSVGRREVFVRTWRETKYVNTSGNKRVRDIISQVLVKLESLGNPFGKLIEIASSSKFLFMFFQRREIVRISLDNKEDIKVAVCTDDINQIRFRDFYVIQVENDLLFIGREIYGKVPIEELGNDRIRLNFYHSQGPIYFDASEPNIIPVVVDGIGKGFVTVSRDPFEEESFVVCIGDFRKSLLMLNIFGESFKVIVKNRATGRTILERVFVGKGTNDLGDLKKQIQVYFDISIFAKCLSLDEVNIRAIAVYDWECQMEWMNMDEMFE
jgi:hypothetical protein